MRKREFTDPRIAESFIHCTCGGNEFLIQTVDLVPTGQAEESDVTRTVTATKCRKCGTITSYTETEQEFVQSYCECRSPYFHVIEPEDDENASPWTICTNCNNLEGAP